MDRELSELIDQTIARREFLAGLLKRAQADGHSPDALTIEYNVAELDGLITLLTRTSTTH